MKTTHTSPPRPMPEQPSRQRQWPSRASLGCLLDRVAVLRHDPGRSTVDRHAREVRASGLAPARRSRCYADDWLSAVPVEWRIDRVMAAYGALEGADVEDTAHVLAPQWRCAGQL